MSFPSPNQLRQNTGEKHKALTPTTGLRLTLIPSSSTTGPLGTALFMPALWR